MRKLLTVFILTALAAGTVSAAGKSVRRDDYPTRYVPRSLDGAIVQVQNDVDGRAWSAWAYRNGAEYDLAVSVSTAPGVWSEPRFVGLDDGMDQGQPSFAVDARGTVYLAYSAGDGTLAVRALRAGSNTWSHATGWTDVRGPVSAPAAKVVAGKLVVGYRLGEGVELTTLPLLPPRTDSVASIYDGPDPTGGKEDDEDDEASNEFDFETAGDSGVVDLRPQGMDDDD